ncbi:DUF2397 family protein [Nonomuraea sp. NPDC050153]|uniref:DUF2397 family protein n=1 Tax=Nonomuraea sp. NPDC050153 TaxID=3364359 RepID=UPI0037B59DAD
MPNAAFHREILRAFARAKERFIVHLRPEDVAAELRRDNDDALTQAPDKLRERGNLRADTGRVTSVEHFHRKRCRAGDRVLRGCHRETRGAAVGGIGRHRRAVAGRPCS